MSNMRSYVKFVHAEAGTAAGIPSLREVSTRDLDRLDIPASADFFYFYDATINPKDGHMNSSPVHIVAQRLVTREQAKKLIAPENAHDKIIWDKRLEENSLFALTRSNTLHPVTKHNIVIDAKKNQLYPKPKPQLRKNFNMKPDKELEAPERASFKPRKPPAFT